MSDDDAIHVATRSTGARSTFRARSMRVGVNFPWRDYGWDFGIAPQGWVRSPRRSWEDGIIETLGQYQQAGISVVRWFILGDGLTYGTPFDPHTMANPSTPWSDPLYFIGQTGVPQWHFNPPVSGAPSVSAIVRDVVRLLQYFALVNSSVVRPRRRIKLLPSIVDHQMMWPGVFSDMGAIKRGRSEVLTEPEKTTIFFDTILEPLLSAMRHFSEYIEAIELINEPEWCVNGFEMGRGSNDRERRELPSLRIVPLPRMQDFIRRSAELVRSAGMNPTVGFANPTTASNWGVHGLIPQLHYYGKYGFPEILQNVPTANGATTILGEFHGAGEEGLEPYRHYSLMDRLIYFESRGYELALLWPHPGAELDSHALGQIRSFTNYLLRSA